MAVASTVALLAGCGTASDLTSSEPDPEPTSEPTDSPAPSPPSDSPAPSPSADPSPIDLSGAESDPVDDPYYPQDGEPYFDALHYQLDLDWNPGSRVLEGKADITFRVTEPRRDILLDFGEPLEITDAAIDGAEVRTTETGEDLTVTTPGVRPGDQHTLTLSYRGTPQPVRAAGSRSDLLHVGWTTESDGSVWTMQEPWGAYTWYPVNDHPSDKAFYDATITTTGGMIGIFNGQMQSKTTKDGATTTRWHLGAPAASYLTTIAIGHYTRLNDTGPGGLPISYWIQQGDRAAVHWLRESPEMLAWLEDRLGDYPFSQAGIVVVPSNSGMETQTLVTIGSGLFGTDPTTIRGDLLHEYAHQWYGDLVTPDNWPDLWLNEGFAMYLQLLWCDSVGLWDYDTKIAEWTALDGQMRAQYGPPGAYKEDEFASANVYYSGALMLDQIRDTIGDDAFFDALKAWPAQHEFGNANRDDYIRWLSDRTGTNLRPLISTWLNSPTTP